MFCICRYCVFTWYGSITELPRHVLDTYTILLPINSNVLKHIPVFHLNRPIFNSSGSAKKFLDTYKSYIFTKMLHIRQIKSLLIMGSRWMSSSSWYETWRNRLINNRVLIIWIETGTFLKVANEAIQLYRAIVIDEQICMLMNGIHNLQLFKTYLSPFKWLELCHLSTKSYKFGIKMKKTSTCFLWYAFNSAYMKHFWRKKIDF